MRGYVQQVSVPGSVSPGDTQSSFTGGLSPGAPAAVFISSSSLGSPCSFSTSEWAALPCPGPEVVQLPVSDLSSALSLSPIPPLFLVPMGPLCSTPPLALLVPSLLLQVPMGNIVLYCRSLSWYLVRHTYSQQVSWNLGSIEKKTHVVC